MYQKAYGIIETLAPLHVGASAGEETGNLNLIFRDQFTQTGIIPGSSIRGRFRADMRLKRMNYQQQNSEKNNSENPPENPPENQQKKDVYVPQEIDENYWYGHESIDGLNKPKDGGTTEAKIKFEYASLVWFPIFCPGQPVVWISCPRLLKRFYKITKKSDEDQTTNISDEDKIKIPEPYTASPNLPGRQVGVNKKVLFFNLGFIEIEHEVDLSKWIPEGIDIKKDNLVVVGDNDIATLHDMGLYRQSRVKMLDDVKKVDTDRGGFFNTEALPEGSILVFPIAAKEKGWKPFGDENEEELYFGGLESIGFGRCQVKVVGDF
ncbi:MAG: type III-B CRISPR module RAMP protein Cmr4 [Okeania sp. SIO3H1]|nr:type III-B CRISPR module RAMP protein Cmr4 [Okeania sp. SIO3H1]